MNLGGLDTCLVLPSEPAQGLRWDLCSDTSTSDCSLLFRVLNSLAADQWEIWELHVSVGQIIQVLGTKVPLAVTLWLQPRETSVNGSELLSTHSSLLHSTQGHALMHTHTLNPHLYSSAAGTGRAISGAEGKGLRSSFSLSQRHNPCAGCPNCRTSA